MTAVVLHVSGRETVPDLPPLRTPVGSTLADVSHDLEPYYVVMRRMLQAIRLVPMGVCRETLDRFGDRQTVNDALGFLRRTGLVSVLVQQTSGGDVQLWFPGRWWEGDDHAPA